MHIFKTQINFICIILSCTSPTSNLSLLKSLINQTALATLFQFCPQKKIKNAQKQSKRFPKRQRKKILICQSLVNKTLKLMINLYLSSIFKQKLQNSSFFSFSGLRRTNNSVRNWAAALHVFAERDKLSRKQLNHWVKLFVYAF